MTISSWETYGRSDFVVDGRAALLIAPREPRSGRPWIWRTEFFGAFPSVDLALLDLGFHLGYIDMQNLYGAPLAMEVMDRFYAHVTSAHDLAAKVVLEGFSRGGLFAFNWAARHPDRVASLYVDAPVCDFKSWPGGLGVGTGSPEDWERCKSAYGLTEAEALTYGGNPVDNLHSLAAARIPILAVCGDADEVVPMEENIRIVEQRYRKLGGEIEVIVKPGCGHHPHSLEDPAPITTFILDRMIA